MKRSLAHVATVLAVVAAVGCGEAGSSQDTTAATSATVTVPASTTTIAASTTTSTTTTSSSTTSSSTTSTIATSTTAAPVPATDWYDFAAMPTAAFPPCCADTWHGRPSPPLTADPEPVADGIYQASRVSWSPTDPTTMVIDVRRFEACGLLSASQCEQPPEGMTFADDQLGVASDPVRNITITLDGSVKVGVTGWDTDMVKRQATGAELVPLMVELDAAYNEVLAAPLLAGGDADAIITGLQEKPARGFGPPPGRTPDSYYGVLVFSYDGAPPLWFEGPLAHTDTGRVPIDATSVLSLTAIQFDHGVVTLYFYAGYYP